jgi:excisionase family DNA binding protein
MDSGLREYSQAEYPLFCFSLDAARETGNDHLQHRASVARCYETVRRRSYGWSLANNATEEFGMNRFLTEEQLSDCLSVSLGTLRRWRLENRGPKFHKLGSLVRYSEYDLDDWLQARPSGGSENPGKLSPDSVPRMDAARRRLG